MTTKKNEQKPDRFAQALGASHTQELPQKSAQGPLGLLQLREQVQHRLVSSGGRPTDPSWTMKRVVPFQPTHWEELERFARVLSEGGRTVSPAQLAALLIEQQLGELEKDEEEGGAVLRAALMKKTG